MHGRILERARAITMMTQIKLSTENKEKVHFPSSYYFLVVLKDFPFKKCFSSIKTLQNGTFYLLFSFVAGNEAENESQTESGLLNMLEG